jgi:CheY-like chemotaxis protein
VDQTPQRILLIEDNPDHALVATRILQRAGYTVQNAATGREGIDAVHEGSYDLVLLDYGLPDMDGMSVLSEISRVGTPVVFVTGRSDAKLAVDALRAGATNYIIKDAHYVSNLPDVARQTLERQSDRLRAVSAVRVRLQQGDEDILHRFFGRFVPADAVVVRYAPGDYLVFGQGGGESEAAVRRLADNLNSFRGTAGEEPLDLKFESFTLDRSGSLRDVLA